MYNCSRINEWNRSSCLLGCPGLELDWGRRKWFDWCQQRWRRACNWPGYKEDSWRWQNRDVASWACRWGWRNWGKAQVHFLVTVFISSFQLRTEHFMSPLIFETYCSTFRTLFSASRSGNTWKKVPHIQEIDKQWMITCAFKTGYMKWDSSWRGVHTDQYCRTVFSNSGKAHWQGGWYFVTW